MRRGDPSYFPPTVGVEVSTSFEQPASAATVILPCTRATKGFVKWFLGAVFPVVASCPEELVGLVRMRTLIYTQSLS